MSVGLIIARIMLIPTPDKQNKLTNSYREEKSQHEYLPRTV